MRQEIFIRRENIAPVAQRERAAYRTGVTKKKTFSRAFASDNWAGVHPDVLRAIGDANAGHAASYGNDEWTAQAIEKIRALVGKDCDVFLLFSGTAANVLGLQSLVRSHASGWPWSVKLAEREGEEP